MSAELKATRKVYFEAPKWARLLDADTNELVFEGPRDYCFKVAEYEHWEIVKTPLEEK